MPEITVLHIGIGTFAVIVGVVIGWLSRARRSSHEKVAINSGWQEQIEAQRIEHGRLAEQNKSLMEQIAQHQASGKDARNRAKELSTVLKETLEARDNLQREVKEIRSSLEAALAERATLESSVESLSASDNTHARSLQERDDKIFQLSRELENWQNRLPPLIEKFRERDTEARQLEVDLAEAREHINALEVASGPARAQDGNGAADATGQHAQVDSRDDLKKIKGVGPAIEKTLNELGIFRFSQIAEMSEYDIDRVARQLKGFRSRIYREDWMGQARELQTMTSGANA